MRRANRRSSIKTPVSGGGVRLRATASSSRHSPAAKIVTSDGVNAPVITDGPFPEAKEYLAGFWMVDVDNEQRAIEIAARTSGAPGPGGRPTGTPIEVRPIMDAPAPEW